MNNILLKRSIILTVSISIPIFSQNLESVMRATGISRQDALKGFQLQQQAGSAIIPQETQFDNNKSSIDDPDLISPVSLDPLPETPNINYYGYNIFNDKKQIEVLENLPTPENYNIGPGDEFIITMWGDTELQQKDIINKDGNVFFEKVGLINLVGLSFEQAKSMIKSRFEKVYSSLKGGEFATTFIEIALGRLKLINVHFVGEVKNPGLIPIHPFSTVTTGLMQAGGVSYEGSLRKIKIIRDGQIISTVDYYKYYKDGEIQDNLRLHNNDIISVPLKNTSIEIDGTVTRSGIYELNDDEKLNDLIYYAGGTKVNAGRMGNIKRIIPLEYRSKEESIYKNIGFVLPIDKETKLVDGDKIMIFPTIESFQKVSISGQVKRPGEFPMHIGMKILDLLELSGGVFLDDYWDSVYPYRADLIRENKINNTTSLLTIRLDLLKNGEEEHNLELRPGDKLLVYSSTINKYRKVVEIFGEVKNPGKYELDENMGLRDLILRSGGFSPNAYLSNIEIVSTDPFQTGLNQKIQMRKISLDNINFDEFVGLDGYKLNHRDQIFVRKHPEFNPQRNINISGQLKFPGDYVLLSENENLGSVIQQAGGLTQNAFISGIKIFRNGKRVIVDRKGRKKINMDILIFPGDTLVIPRNFNTVEVVGEVNSPGLIQYQKGLSVGDYINIAGQITKNGDKKTISVYYANGESKGLNFFHMYPKVLPESKIVVYKKAEQLPLDRTSYYSEVTSTIIQSMSLLLMANRLANN